MSRIVRQRFLPALKTASATLRNTQLAPQVVMAIGANLLIAIIGLVTGSFLARVLGPEGRGQLAVIQIWAGMIAAFAMLGQHEAVVYFVVRNRSYAREITKSTTVVTLSCGLAISILGCIALPKILSDQPESVIQASQCVLILLTIGYATTSMWIQVIRASADYLIWHTLRVGAPLLWMMLILASQYLDITVTPEFLAIAFATTNLVLIVPAGLTLLRRLPVTPSQSVRWTQPMLRYGVPVALGALPRLLSGQIDQLFLIHHVSGVDLGLYVVAIAWSASTTPIFSVIDLVVFPLISASRTLTNQGRNARRVLFVSTPLYMLGNGVLMLITPFLLPKIFGSEFTQAVPLSLVLIASKAFYQTNSTIETMLQGTGRTRTVMLVEIVSCVLMVLVLQLLVPAQGAMGAAYAVLITYGLTTILLLMQLKTALGARHDRLENE